MVDLATKSLLHDKLRFLITVSGVAFAVTLVFVQVGLFLGLLDNASVTIDHIDADLWVTSRNTPNVDFAHTFPDTAVQRVRSVPGVERADNLIVWFVTVNLPTGAQEGSLVYALEDFPRWNIPWNVESRATSADLQRGQYFFLDDSAVKRYGAFAVGEYREILGPAHEDHRPHEGRPLVHHHADLLHRLRPGADAQPAVAPGQDDLHPRQARARRRRRRPSRRRSRAACPTTTSTRRRSGPTRSRGYWVESTGLGLNMYITVFLGCLVGVVVVAQTLYTSTMEHIKEFGTVKAIGGGNLDIYRILGKQASIAAVVGFVLGALMAFAMRPAIAKIDLKLIIPPAFAAIVFVGTVVLCLAAAMISFRKVASIDPALVFRAGSGDTMTRPGSTRPSPRSSARGAARRCPS